MKKYLALLLTLVLVVAVSVMAVSAATGDIDFSAGGTVSAVCPHCGGEKVDWLPLTKTKIDAWNGDYSTANGTHYYMAEESITFGKTLSIGKSESLCLHLNGKTVTRGNSARAFSMDGTLNLLDHAANTGLVTCMASNSSGGSVVRINSSTGVFNMRGGTLELRTNDAKAATSMGGNGGCVWVAGSGKFNMYGGIIKDGIAGDGGNVYLCESAQFKMYGGTIQDGKTAVDAYTSSALTNTQRGANLYLAKSSVFEMYGGAISGGVSMAAGGNIYAASSTKVTITDDGDAATPAPVISDGQVTNTNTGGGNIQSNGTTKITGAVISGGKATYGGSVYVASGTTTVNATVTGGYASSRGGNFYISSIGNKLNITGGTVSDGVCASYGGNIYANNGYVTITGGTISGGKGTGGGNIYSNVGNADAETYPSTLNNYVKIADDGDPATPAPVITGGIATSERRKGGNILSVGILQLGDCVIENGISPGSGRNIMLGSTGKLKILSSFAGETDFDFAFNHLPVDANDEYLEPTLNTCEGPFSGKLYLESAPQRYLYGMQGDTKVYITSALLQKKDGTAVYYKYNEDLVAAYGTDTASIRPASGELKLTGGDYVVDLYGRDIAVTGTGKVTCIDTANADPDCLGSAAFDGPELQNTSRERVAGKYYFTTEDNGAFSFHQLDMRLTSVAVRPSNTGIYYQGVWLCDESLADKIDTFGVAVSLVDLPDADFRDDQATLYTQFTKSEFVVGSERSGVLIKDILEEGATNNTSRSKRDIYAAAYIVFNDGSVVITDDNIAYSLYDAATIVSQNPEVFATSVQPMNDLKEKWNLNWELNFEVDPDVLQLQTVYAGTTAYHGELHDHSDSGKNSDGKLTPDQWKVGLKRKNMDFATLVDHKQVEHMFADFWDPTIFIGGSEAAALLDYLPADKNKIHINMIFAESEGFVNTVSSFAPFKYKDGYFTYPWTGNELSKEQVTQLVELVRANGGLFVNVHPKSTGYIDSEDPLDYWFADWTGLEVHYGISGYAPNQYVNKLNYQLWTDLLALGKRVWATAGCDQHDAPQTHALTTIYATERHATAWLDQARTGNMVCGPVGIRMSIGNTPMGSQTSFEGKRLALSVGDIHDIAYYEDHTYRFDVLSDTGVVYSQEFDQDTTTYYGMDADPNVKFYRVEIYDVTTDTRIAIGNPIWNEAFYD